MNSSKSLWDEMLYQAVAFQQSIYELIPNWSVYNKDHVAYIKQNIGYAIYGAPSLKQITNSNDIPNLTDETKLNDLINYGPDANALINKIFTKIYTNNHIDKNDNISVGIIYNMIFHSKTSTNCTMKKDELIALPIFKVLRYAKDNKNVPTTCYIDTSARVYTNWEDYLLSNNLPQCTMVFPVQGCYQPNPDFKITPKHSFVWLTAMDSYACSSLASFNSKVDKTMNAIGTASSVGLGVLSLINPVSATITIPVMVASAASNTWTIGKCSTSLYDKSVHEESISPSNKDALSAWLGIATCTINLGVTATSLSLRNAAASGKTVKSVTKAAHNTLAVCSISVNLLGLCSYGYDIYKKYKENNINIEDILHFGCCLLFFTNNMISIKFANTIIETTQGEILQDYKVNLCNENMLKHYEHVKNNAAINYPKNQTAQNAAVIRYINTINLNNVPSWIDNCIHSMTNNGIKLTKGVLKINGITLIDPMSFIKDFMKSYMNNVTASHPNQSNNDWVDDNPNLLKILESLLSDLYLSGNYSSNKYATILDFKPLINSIKNFRINPEHILPSIFNVAVSLLKTKDKIIDLVETCCFIWNYIKRNLKEFQESSYDTLVKHIKLIIISLYDAIELMSFRFFNALEQYIQLVLKQTVQYSFSQ